jgi:hypothetical protein
MMENRDWEFCVVGYETGGAYFAQHKSTRRDSDEEILQSDLTKAEAMALLSLIGEPNVLTLNSCYYARVFA